MAEKLPSLTTEAPPSYEEFRESPHNPEFKEKQIDQPPPYPLQPQGANPSNSLRPYPDHSQGAYPTQSQGGYPTQSQGAYPSQPLAAPSPVQTSVIHPQPPPDTETTNPLPNSQSINPLPDSQPANTQQPQRSNSLPNSSSANPVPIYYPRNARQLPSSQSIIISRRLTLLILSIFTLPFIVSAIVILVIFV